MQSNAKGVKRKREDSGTTQPVQNPEKQQSEGHKKPKIVLPPLPADLFGTDETKDTEEITSRKAHGGRIRSFPHVEGNYPTFVFLDIPLTSAKVGVSSSIKQFERWLVENLPKPEESESLPAVVEETAHHISLSRTFALRKHQINPFIDLLREELKSIHKLSITFSTIPQIFTNDEKTRSFLSLLVVHGKQDIIRIISHVDSVLKQFNLPVYYDEPQPHMTIAWTLGDVLKGETQSKMLDTHQTDLVPTCGEWEVIEIAKIQCKIGEWLYTFDLK